MSSLSSSQSSAEDLPLELLHGELVCSDILKSTCKDTVSKYSMFMFKHDR